jgi:HlyD family secretion protein
MTARAQAKNTSASVGRKPYRTVGTALLVSAIGLAVIWMTVVHGGQDPAGAVETFAARRGPLTIRVLEAGSLMAKNPEIVRSTLRRPATILTLIPEGVWVKKGDLLIELDVSEIIDHCVDHRIMVTNAKAAWINSQENLTILRSQAQSTVELAQLRYEFAQQDLEKYTGDNGEYSNLLASAEGKIALNEEELRKAQDYYDWSRKLYDEKYLSETQRQADELAMKRASLNLTIAKNDAKLLKQYSYHRKLAQLASDVNQAKMALERAQAKARANLIQAEANLAAREQECKHQEEMLARHEEEVRESRMYAPTDGMVIYATSGRGGHHDDRQPLADGVEVWYKQELIYLQKSNSIVAEVDLHEANLQKVRMGMPAIVTVDALPGRKFMGTVTRVAPLPDPQSMWMNPDLKVYQTEIALEANEPDLRSGMNCRAEIVVEQHNDTIYVPVQTVVRVGGRPAAYVLNDAGRIEERQVEVGLDDNTMIRVVSGLNEGEQVVLSPPLETATAAPEAGLAAIRGADANDLAQQIRARLKAPAAAPAAWHPKSSGPGQVTTQ